MGTLKRIMGINYQHHQSDVFVEVCVCGGGGGGDTSDLISQGYVYAGMRTIDLHITVNG